MCHSLIPRSLSAFTAAAFLARPVITTISWRSGGAPDCSAMTRSASDQSRSLDKHRLHATGERLVSCHTDRLIPFAPREQLSCNGYRTVNHRAKPPGWGAALQIPARAWVADMT